MASKLFTICGVLAALAVAIWLTVSDVPRPAIVQAQDETYGDLSITAMVAQKFTYQGVLKRDGVPVNGTRDMIFRLFTNPSCTTQVGADIARPGVPLQNGMFTADLEVTIEQVNGQALWLEVEIAGLPIGCQEIVPVPYALSLMPEALVAAPDIDSYTLHLQNGAFHAMGPPPKSALMASTNNGIAVYARSQSSTGIRAVGSPAGAFAGDVEQGLNDNGLVKAAVFAFCDDVGATIHRSFNAVNDTAITIADGGDPGECTIDFGFDISNRYIVAVADTTGPAVLERGVVVRNSAGTAAEFYRFNTVDGGGREGDIAVIVY